MLEKVEWTKYGVVNGVARDPRCENCMVHCGYDPSGALGTNYQPGDNWKNFRYNFAPRPAPSTEGHAVKAFNGVSIGKGHLAEAKAAVKDGLNASSGCSTNGGSSCSSGDGSVKEQLLEKIRAAK